jgi:hypothetical protein
MPSFTPKLIGAHTYYYTRPSAGVCRGHDTFLP